MCLTDRMIPPAPCHLTLAFVWSHNRHTTNPEQAPSSNTDFDKKGNLCNKCNSLAYLSFPLLSSPRNSFIWTGLSSARDCWCEISQTLTIVLAMENEIKTAEWHPVVALACGCGVSTLWIWHHDQSTLSNVVKGYGLPMSMCADTG